MPVAARLWSAVLMWHLAVTQQSPIPEDLQRWDLKMERGAGLWLRYPSAWHRWYVAARPLLTDPLYSHTRTSQCSWRISADVIMIGRERRFNPWVETYSRVTIDAGSIVLCDENGKDVLYNSRFMVATCKIFLHRAPSIETTYSTTMREVEKERYLQDIFACKQFYAKSGANDREPRKWRGNWTLEKERICLWQWQHSSEAKLMCS